LLKVLKHTVSWRFAEYHGTQMETLIFRARKSSAHFSFLRCRSNGFYCAALSFIKSYVTS